MAIQEGDRLPDAELLRMGDSGPEAVSLTSLVSGKTVALFALPGAYTGVCTTAHVPSFIRTKDQFADKGVSEVICIAVNDPFVMKAWGADTGATEAGIHMLGDADGAFTRAVGMGFDAPPAGFHGRSRRYAMIVEDGVVKTLHAEESPGVCETSGGEALLATV
ncbi:peroxiredoxin [uncultured Jannaschia sp.]|uniref:peroxiredoxin n=1 Tax=uncultured Jannaschia sp. TaxID=293347 RepID=UPI002628DCE6|nr:peroxiredoxin [uncultured Jannaschia sp.]